MTAPSGSTASGTAVAPDEGGPGSDPDSASLERSIAHLLTGGTYASIVLLAIGLVLLLAKGLGPLSDGPAFDPTAIPGDLLALRPAGFLWLGLIVVVATPSARVAASLVGYVRRREPMMVLVAVLILAVIVASVALAKGLEG